jgi:integrase
METSAHRQLVLLADISTLPESLAERLKRHQEQARGAFSAATEAALRSDSKIFTGWCADRGESPLPCAPEVVADFVDQMAESRAPATVRRYTSSIGHLHRAAGLANPCASEVVKLSLKRMFRERGRAQKQAAGLNFTLRARMIDAAPDSLLGKRDRAILAIGYDALMRRSEIAALNVEDLETAEDGSAVAVIRRSKTDQEGEGAVAFLAPDSIGFVREWIEAAGITEGPLFRSMRGPKIGTRLGPWCVSDCLRRLAKAAGIDPEMVKDLSSHSCRVGGCQDMSAAGLGLSEIMQSGRWKSSRMVARYAEKTESRRGAAAKLAMAQGRY